jgi:L-lactate dehydrogenase complex protein LldG
MVEADPMNAREEILGRIRGALNDVPRDEPDDRDIERNYQRTSGLDHEGVLELFAETVADYKATVRRVPAADRVAAIGEILAGRGLRRIAVPADLPRDWLPAGLEVSFDSGQLTSADLDAVDGAVSCAAVGIASTGTLILDASAGQGRRLLSLVPDYHLCIIEADQVVGSVPEAVRRLDPSRPITLISGPSATSDIELNRVEGVHGPRTLDVLLVE